MVVIAAVLPVMALVVPLWAGGLALDSRDLGGGAEGEVSRPTIVLVHGDWADGSSWSGVIERLQRQGSNLVAPPNPLRAPSTDAPYLASFLQTIPGPIVLVAHSYGGFVVTNAATGNPNVQALVYVDAIIPNLGQTAAELNPGSCADPAAFNAGGVVDLYLRVEANPPRIPASPNASPTG